MSRRTSPVIPGFGLTLGYTLVYLSLLVLIPLGALFVHAAQLSWAEFWAIISAPRVVAALKLSFGTAFVAALVNGVIGTLLAWAEKRPRQVRSGGAEVSFTWDPASHALRIELPVGGPVACAIG